MNFVLNLIAFTIGHLQDKKGAIVFEVRERNPLFVLGVLCIVAFSFVVVDTHLPRFEVLA